MFAISSIDLRQAAFHLFVVAVEGALVVGLVLLILAPGADGGQSGGPDRPPAPLTSPVRS